MSRQNIRQLSLFADEVAEPGLKPTKRPTEPPPEPAWEFLPGLEHQDLIGDEPVTVFMFRIDDLRRVAPLYDTPVLRQVLRFLADLSSKTITGAARSCMIYVGEMYDAYVEGGVDDIFALAISAADEKTWMLLQKYLATVPGACGMDSGMASQFIPKYRYDQRYCIEYSDEGLEGTKYTDTAEYLGSGLTLYRRIWNTPESYGRRRSAFGKLRKL